MCQFFEPIGLIELLESIESAEFIELLESVGFMARRRRPRLESQHKTVISNQSSANSDR